MVPEGGLTHYVNYTANSTGRFLVNVEAQNELNSTTFELQVEVVPEIVEQEWQVTSDKPWVSRERERERGNIKFLSFFSEYGRDAEC